VCLDDLILGLDDLIFLGFADFFFEYIFLAECFEDFFKDFFKA
jgi:hypothetical protein